MKQVMKIAVKLIKMVLTPEMKKQMFVFLGDSLVKSTKNKLDDKIWNSVKSIF